MVLSSKRGDEALTHAVPTAAVRAALGPNRASGGRALIDAADQTLNAAADIANGIAGKLKWRARLDADEAEMLDANAATTAAVVGELLELLWMLRRGPVPG